MRVSIIIVSKGIKNRLYRLLDSILSQKKDNHEVILVNELGGKKRPESFPEEVTYISTPLGSGIPIARNKGIKKAKGSVVVFIDDDCIATKYWLKNLLRPLKNVNVDVVMGCTKTQESDFIGNSISALGFPAGGSVGFRNMWIVSKDGFTDHISTCNCAIRKSVFNKVGMFDESMRFGGEDAEFSYRLKQNKIKVLYCDDSVVIHEANTDVYSFLKWQLKRGRANYYFKQKVGNVTPFFRLRLWSTKNIIKKYYKERKIIFIMIFLILSFIFQQLGYFLERLKTII